MSKHKPMSEPLPTSIRPTDLAAKAEISMPYASQVLAGARPLTRALAIKIWDKFGEKLGPLATAPDSEIDVLRKYEAA